MCRVLFFLCVWTIIAFGFQTTGENSTISINESTDYIQMNMMRDDIFSPPYINVIVGKQNISAIIDLEFSDFVILFNNTCLLYGMKNCFVSSQSPTFSTCTRDTCPLLLIDSICTNIAPFANFFIDEVDFGPFKHNLTFVNSNSIPLSESQWDYGARFGLGKTGVRSNANALYHILNLYQTKILSLNIQPPGHMGYLKIGAPPSENVVWAEVNEIAGCPKPNYYAFTIFHPKICGVRILTKFMSNFLTYIDIEEPCLVLHPSFLETIKSWAPLNCTTNGPCSITDDFENLNDLPPITFTLSEDGPELVLPLKGLLTGRNREICIKKSSGISLDPLPGDLVFGSMTFHYLNLFLDWKTDRVGLEMKEVINPNFFCPERKESECFGGQTFNEQKNMCQSPTCNAYVFQTVDEKTQTCILNPGFKSSVITAAIVLSVAEMCRYLLYLFAVDRVKRSYLLQGPNTPTPST